MAIYDDNFQGYSPGAQAPFGSWQLVSAITNVIVSGSAPTGMTKSYRLFGTVVLDPTVPGYITSFTEYFALRRLSGVAGPAVNFANGPNGSGHTFSLVTIQIESDSTVSVVGPDSTVIANSIDEWFQFNVVNFFQVNVQLSDVLVSGTNMIHVNVHVGLNGRQIISVSYTSAVPVSQLTNGTSEVNRFELISPDGFYSAFTLDTLQTMVSYPHAGSPKARVNQAAAEANVLPDSAILRVIQAVAESNVLPDSAKLRVIQAVAEADCLAANRWYISES